MATSMYSWIHGDYYWTGDDQTTNEAYPVAGKFDTKPKSDPNTEKPKIERKCWNCDSEDHMLNNCTKSKNQAKIDANRARFQSYKKLSGKSSGKKKPPPKTKMIDGKSMICNKN